MLDIEKLLQLKKDWDALPGNRTSFSHYAYVHIPNVFLDIVEEIQQHRADLAEAAGELLVPLPEPGSDMAKVCISNRLLKARVQELELSTYDMTITRYLNQILDRNTFLETLKWDGEALDGFKADGSVEPFGSGEFNEPTRCIWEAVETLLFYTEPKVGPFTFWGGKDA